MTKILLETTFSFPEVLAYLLDVLIKIALIILPLLIFVAYTTYAERKIIGFMQVRLGPNRVGFKGLLQPFADLLKLVFKEIIFPKKSNRYLYILAPILTLVPALSVWGVIPFSENLILADIDVSIIYVFAISSIGVYGMLLGGWASNSKYALLGAMRSSAIMVSYEIALGFCIIAVAMMANSLSIADIIQSQKGGFFNWNWLPLFPIFIIFFISALVETNRAPFDIVEGESEVVGGVHVEYSGISFGMFFLAEYANMIFMCTLSAIMFLGGYLSPFPSIALLKIDGIHWLVFKTCILIFMFLWIRATLPRYRYDQIMRLGWKIFIPITAIWIMLIAIMQEL